MVIFTLSKRCMFIVPMIPSFIGACLMSLNVYFFKKNKYLERIMFFQAKVVSLPSKNLAKCISQIFSTKIQLVDYD
jgi:hypothetical protein